MISNLGLYSSRFEPRFIEASREYYTLLAKRESQAHGLTTYIKECAEQIEKEGIRCDKFHLDISTKRELVAVIEEEMIRKKVPLLTCKKRVRGLLERGDSSSLQILYQLLERVGDAGESLKLAWEAYIIEEGSKVVTDKEKEADMVPRLLDFKGILISMWKGPLKKNAIIGYSLRESFSSFINERREGASMKDNSKPAEMIAKYVDLLLRIGVKGLPPVAGADADLEGTYGNDAVLAYRLELVIDLFRFIQGKDVFEAFYKKDLAKRLLLARSASVDAEGLMLTKLKTGIPASVVLGGYILRHNRMRRRIYKQPGSNVQRHGIIQRVCKFVQHLKDGDRESPKCRPACQYPLPSSLAVISRGSSHSPTTPC